MKRVLLIDDEAIESDHPSGNYMWYYRERLRHQFQVVIARDPDEAVATLKNREEPFDIVVLDVMMPPGQALANRATQDGLSSGVFLVKLIGELNADLPIIVLTNSNAAGLVERMKNEPNVKKFLSKVDFTPLQLVEEVVKILAPAADSHARPDTPTNER